MTDIREQIKGAKVFAALSMTKPTHHLCGIKVELLTDTLEKLLAVYEAADKCKRGGLIDVPERYRELADAIAAVEALAGDGHE